MPQEADAGDAAREARTYADGPKPRFFAASRIFSQLFGATSRVSAPLRALRVPLKIDQPTLRARTCIQDAMFEPGSPYSRAKNDKG